MMYTHPPIPRRWMPLLPLAEALGTIPEELARRALQRRGMEIAERRLAGQDVVTYHIPGPADQPPIVMVHGLGASAMTWAQLMARLRGTAPIYALDLVGFGHSALGPQREPLGMRGHLNVVQALLEQVVGAEALLVGSSLGGWISLRIALERPDLVRGVVGLNPGGIFAERELWEATGQLFAPGDIVGVRTFYKALFSRVPAPMYLVQPMMLRRLWRRAVQGFVAQTAEEDFLLPDDLRAISVPTTIAWGACDGLLPATCLDVVRSAMPHAHVVVLPESGHLPQVERTGEVASVVLAALRAGRGRPQSRGEQHG